MSFFFFFSEEESFLLLLYVLMLLHDLEKCTGACVSPHVHA